MNCDPASKILPPHDAALQRAADALRAGRLVGMPTETVYGLAADALNPVAVAHVFEVKARPRFDPLIVHCPDTGSAQECVADWPEQAQILAQALWPGPLTLVLPRREHIADIVTAGLPSVGVRVPSHPVTHQLLRLVDRPLAAPSANRFGGVSPTRPDHVITELGDAEMLDCVLDGGDCRTGVESTVLSLPHGRGGPESPIVLRLGGVSVEAIEALIGPVDLAQHRYAANLREAEQQGLCSPGTLSRHYAPCTPLTLWTEESPPPMVEGECCGLLSFTRLPAWADEACFADIEVLSERGDPAVAAARLFAAMREMDHLNLDRIIALPAPDEGLGRAINDRLSRAATA